MAKPYIVQPTTTDPTPQETVRVEATVSLEFGIYVSTDGEESHNLNSDYLSGVRIFKARMDKALNEAVRKVFEMGKTNAEGSTDYADDGLCGPNWTTKLDR